MVLARECLDSQLGKACKLAVGTLSIGTKPMN